MTACFAKLRAFARAIVIASIGAVRRTGMFWRRAALDAVDDFFLCSLIRFFTDTFCAAELQTVQTAESAKFLIAIIRTFIIFGWAMTGLVGILEFLTALG